MGTLSVDKIVKTSSGAAEFTLPATDGAAGQVMQTDGSGQLSIAALAADTVGNTQMADDAVGVAELSATGTASGTTALFGDNAWKAVSDVSGLASVQTFTTLGSQPWNRPTGITKVIIEVQGGGGGGARATGGASNVGGGGGGYARKFLDVSSIASATLIVGAGGTGATSTGNGGDGGDSSWSDGTNTITGSGGSGGPNTSYGNGGGGTGTNGDLNIGGQTGMSSTYSSGGSSQFGNGGWNTWTGQYTGGDATGYGGGGGGGTNTPGGDGTQGVIIVTEYK